MLRFLAVSEKRNCISPLRALSPGAIQLMGWMRDTSRGDWRCNGRSAGRPMIGDLINAVRSFISFSKTPLRKKKERKWLSTYLNFWYRNSILGEKCLWKLVGVLKNSPTSCKPGLELFNKRIAPPCVSKSLHLVTLDVIIYRRIKK